MALVSLAALVAGARSGKLVSFPTDTVPALAVRPDRSADIFTLKQFIYNFTATQRLLKFPQYIQRHALRFTSLKILAFRVSALAFYGS